jgi:Replication-relaxation
MRPVVRPTALSQTTRDPLAGGQLAAIRAAEDSSSPRLLRVSTSRLADISQQLTDCDRAVMELVADLRLVSGAQLERAFWWHGSPEARGRRARRALKRLTAWRILDRLPRSIGGVRAGSRGFVYGLGPVGLRLMAADGRTRRLGTPGARHVDHTLAVAELAIRLREAERAGRLELLTANAEPACWRTFTGPLGARLTVKPDLFVRIGAGSYEDRWFVEVDRATEAAATITGKGRQYLAHFRSGAEQRAHGIYPRVLWSVPDASRAEVVAEALAGLSAPVVGLFIVCCHDDAVDRLAEESIS